MLRTRIATVIAAAAVLASGAAAAAAAPAAPDVTTYYSEISYEGGGNFLATCGAHGDEVVFLANPGGCDTILWVFQNLGGTPTRWFIHPSNNTGLCLDVSESGLDLWIESCGASNDNEFTHPESAGGYFTIYDPYLALNVDDPGSPGTTHQAIVAGPAGWGDSGQVLKQTSS